MGEIEQLAQACHDNKALREAIRLAHEYIAKDETPPEDINRIVVAGILFEMKCLKLSLDNQRRVEWLGAVMERVLSYEIIGQKLY